MKCNINDCSGLFPDGYCDECGKHESSMSDGGQAKTQMLFASEVKNFSKVVEDCVLATAVFADMKTAWRERQNTKLSFDRNTATWPLPKIEAIEPESRIIGNDEIERQKKLGKNFSDLLKEGEILSSQYRIVGPLSVGGMGCVYLAYDIYLKRHVVLKGVINTDDSEAIGAALFEKQLMSSVHHPSIVSISDYISYKNSNYIVMEFLEGMSLRDFRRQKGPLSVNDALGCIMGILPALELLHERGFSYCDLKPDNIMLLTDGTVKLIDLGSVRRIDETQESIYGTEGFLPEKNTIPSVALDIYTVGRTIAALILDFAHTTEYRYSLPMAASVNRMFSTTEILNRTGNIPDSITFSIEGFESLPAWLSHSVMKDRAGDTVHVIHGNAPYGFSQLAIHATPSSGSAFSFYVSCPLANESLLALLKRATDEEPEARFRSIAEIKSQCSGIVRSVMGIQGIPSCDYFPFVNRKASINETIIWALLPPPALGRASAAHSTLLSIIEITDMSQRCEDLVEIITKNTNPDIVSDSCLRYIDTVLSMAAIGISIDSYDANIKLYLRISIQADPWDWKPVWMEGRYRSFRNERKEALACFRKVLVALPGEMLPRLAMAMLLEISDKKEAASMYEACLNMLMPSENGFLFRIIIGLFAADMASFESYVNSYCSKDSSLRKVIAYALYNSFSSMSNPSTMAVQRMANFINDLSPAYKFECLGIINKRGKQLKEFPCLGGATMNEKSIVSLRKKIAFNSLLQKKTFGSLKKLLGEYGA